MAAEVPWWSNLVAVLGTAVVSVLGTVYFIKGASGPTVKGPPGIGALLKETMLYLPHIMLLFGVLADMFTMQGVYSIPSLVGLLSMPISGFVMKYFWIGVGDSVRYIVELIGMRKSGVATAVAAAATTPSTNPFKGPAEAPVAARTRSKGTSALPAAVKGGAPIVSTYDGCTVQGFSGIQSPYAPQTLVVTATVFWYYIIDLMVSRGPSSAALSLGVFLVFYVAQMFLIGDCTVEGTTVQVSRWLKGIIAMSEGALYGGAAFAAVSAKYPTKLPSSVLPVFPAVDPSTLIPSPDGSGSLTDPITGQKFKLLNGIPIPDMCEGADALTGVPGLPGVCPSNSSAAKPAAK